MSSPLLPHSVSNPTGTNVASEMGYSSGRQALTMEERKRAGAKIEETLKGESEAAPAPMD